MKSPSLVLLLLRQANTNPLGDGFGANATADGWALGLISTLPLDVGHDTRARASNRTHRN
jgi:hypothetical protein